MEATYRARDGKLHPLLTTSISAFELCFFVSIWPVTEALQEKMLKVLEDGHIHIKVHFWQYSLSSEVKSIIYRTFKFRCVGVAQDFQPKTRLYVTRKPDHAVPHTSWAKAKVQPHQGRTCKSLSDMRGTSLFASANTLKRWLSMAGKTRRHSGYCLVFLSIVWFPSWCKGDILKVSQIKKKCSVLPWSGRNG